MEWKTVKLGEICKIFTGKKDVNQTIKDGLYPFFSCAPTPYRSNDFIYDGNVILVAGNGSFTGRVSYYSGKFDLYQRTYACVPIIEDIDFIYLYFYMKALFEPQYMGGTRGSSIPYIVRGDLSNFEISLPLLETQRRIAAILSSLDDKIENNNRINRNLEAQAQALFKSWFVDFEPWGGIMPEDWKEDSLTNIADFLNGLAMQKFPAKDIENSLPVLKIKELGQKHCDESSDRCTKEIKPEYIIHDGDVIFSWSGTLLVDIWCGGDCGLNQHLFKVSSNKYPKWFYYLWTIQHLQNFKRIASDKAVTMGHIKRGDLDKSIVLIPNDNVLEKMTAILTPLLDSIVSNAQESSRLAALRDTLLPKLMKGEVIV